MRSSTRSMVLALTMTLAATAVTPPCAAQSVNNESQAVTRFNRGRQMFMAQDYEHALEEFRAALSLVGSPNTRLYIGRCLHALHRNAEALVEFQRAAAEAADRAAREPRYAGTRDVARSEASAVEPLVGSLTVHVPHAPPGVTVNINGTAVPAGGWDVPIPFDPGNVEVNASAQGFESFTRSVAVTAAHETTVTVELTALPPSTPPPAHEPAPGDHGATPLSTGNPSPTSATDPTEPVHPVQSTEVQTTGGGVRTAGIAITILGVVVGGGGGVSAYLAQARYNELRNQCGQTGCGPEYDGRISEGQTYQLLANVGIAVGAVALVAGVVMIAAGGPTEVSAGTNSNANTHAARNGRHAHRAWSVWGAPSTDASGGMLGVVGAF